MVCDPGIDTGSLNTFDLLEADSGNAVHLADVSELILEVVAFYLLYAVLELFIRRIFKCLDTFHDLRTADKSSQEKQLLAELIQVLVLLELINSD